MRTLPLLLAATLGCAPPPAESQGAAKDVISLDYMYTVRTTTYVLPDPSVPPGGAGALASYQALSNANGLALLCELGGLLPGITLMGAPKPFFLQRVGDRYWYDYEASVMNLEASQLEGFPSDGRGGATINLLRPQRTNAGLLLDPCRAPPSYNPEVARTTSTPYGFERVQVTLTPTDDQVDAWPDIRALTHDGVLDIDVHFGVLDDDKQLAAAEAFVDHLRSQGYAWPGPARGFASIDPRAGPFVRRVQSPTGPVEVDVRVIFGRTGTAFDPTQAAGADALTALTRQSLATRDVVVFIGHQYGVERSAWTTGLVANTPSGLSGTDFQTLTLAGRPQIIVSEGCSTAPLIGYLKLNPTSHDGANLDFVGSASTTFVNTDAAARATLQLLVGKGPGEDLRVGRYLPMLRALNAAGTRTTTARLVDFIDDNPRIHPYADPSLTGLPCEGTCGPGMACLPFPEGNRCTPECTQDRACGALVCRTLERALNRGDDARYCLPP